MPFSSFRFSFLLLALSLGARCANSAPVPSASSWKLIPFGSTDKLLASNRGKLEAFKPTPVLLDAVRGENVSFQFVVTAGQTPIQSLSVAPTTLATFDAQFLAPSSFSFFRENYVRVQKPSGNRQRTPKWWPDALVPLSLASQKIEANGSAVFWANVRIPEDAAPGDYFGELDILANGQPRRLALTIHVRPLKLPANTFRGTVALYYDTLRDWYRKNGNTFSDEEWQTQKQRYAQFLLDFGLNPYDPPVAWNDATVDAYLKDPRVHSVRTPSLDSPDFPVAIEALKRTETQSKAFYYWNDEPRTKEQFARIKTDAAKLRALGIPQLVTAHPSPELVGSVDIWCPNIANAMGTGHLDIAQLRREQKQGRPTWLYTMVVPKHPYPTWLLDDDSSAILSYAPLWNRVGASGFVYSMAHGWGPKPLDNLESFGSTNGDGTLVYPSELGGVGPMPSIRLMLLRDAMEDLGLWNEATRRNLAPSFSFPLSRSGALNYDRTTLLNALESGKRAPQKPDAAPQLFPLEPTKTSFKLPLEKKLGAQHTIRLFYSNRKLFIRLSGPALPHAARLVLVLAPTNAQPDQGVRKYDLNSMPTALSAFETDRPDVFAVPVLRDSVRFNVLLRSPGKAARLFPDGNDPFLMPILQLR